MPHMPGFGSWVLIALIGVLFFGKRLPEVGKSVAGAIVNFKKGLKEAQEEITHGASEPSTERPAIAAKNVESLPGDAKFDPYTGKPIEQPKFDPYTGKPIDSQTVVSHGEAHETVA
jgi:sec-independent protein translocase protein TatA